MKEATGHITSNTLLAATDWWFFPEAHSTAIIRLKLSVRISSTALDANSPAGTIRRPQNLLLSDVMKGHE